MVGETILVIGSGVVMYYLVKITVGLLSMGQKW